MALSRRQFGLLAGTAGAALRGIAAEPLTADAVIKRIQSALGGDWPTTGVEAFKAGDPSTIVKGIATTAMATQDVLIQSAAVNANLILTYEPTFYGRADARPPALANDPIVKAKRDFIEKNSLVIFRLHDHWQARQPNEMVTALAATLGWSSRRVKPDDVIYQIPATPAEAVVDHMRSALRSRGGLRVVGDKNTLVRRILLYPGSMQPPTMWTRYTEVDMVIAGEVREWENTLYAADIVTAGQHRVLVTIGRVMSEGPGMQALAAWLETIVPEVPVKWCATGDPYWSPRA